MQKVIGVVVSYEPDADCLRNLLDLLLPQLHAIIVVDNGSPAALINRVSRGFSSDVNLLPLGENLGVAAAQNAGIDWAREHGATHVVLFDQDSEPSHDMVSTLVDAVIKYKNMGGMVACAGPRYTDERQQNPPPFIRVEGLRLKRQACNESDAVIPVDYLISSGCLIPLSTLDAVGGMRDELFIDYVDIEWGLRAKQVGFQPLGVCAATMRHHLGEMPFNLLGKPVPMRNPLRHYYIFRNAILLYRQPWVPGNWKWVDGYRLLLKFIFYSLFGRSRLQHMRMMALGLMHGLKGRSGRF